MFFKLIGIKNKGLKRNETSEFDKKMSLDESINLAIDYINNGKVVQISVVDNNEKKVFSAEKKSKDEIIYDYY